MNATLDYQLVRNSQVCPFCHAAKPIGNLACWPCYRREDMRNGDSIKVESTLKATEGALALGGEVV